MKREAATELEFIRAGIEAAGMNYLNRLTTGQPRITLISPDGTVLFDNEYDTENMENHAERAEVQGALTGKTGENFRFSETQGKQAYYRAVMLNDGKILRISVNMDTIIDSALGILQLTMAIVLVIFICSIIIASKITRLIVKPINALNLEKPEDNDIYDELSPLLSRIKAQNDQLGSQIAELRKKQIEFQAITDNMREGLLLLDKEGHILSSNQTALKLLQVRPAPRENKNVLFLRRDEPFRLVLEKVLNGIPAECLLSAQSSRLRLMASPVMDGGNTQGAVLLLLDVTEQEERERLRREFSANVSHELKTPLTVISGYAEILSQGLAKPDDAPDFGAKIYAESRRLLNLINDIMQLSHLDEGILERENVNLYSLVSGVVERAAPIARSKNIQISLEGENAVISGVPQVLQEMAFNLLENSIKYNNTGGKVAVSITQDEKTIRLCVADNGFGIPLAEQERVFERFYRVDKSRNTENGGTGLGLSIVKHGAQLHDAGIDLESNGISGCKITLIFAASRFPASRSL
jgi:two-component system phosphate regulon sensor histidine kinase PhoR